MMVMSTAMTPSLNASRRVFVIGPLRPLYTLKPLSWHARVERRRFDRAPSLDLHEDAVVAGLRDAVRKRHDWRNRSFVRLVNRRRSRHRQGGHWCRSRRVHVCEHLPVAANEDGVARHTHIELEIARRPPVLV